MSNKNELISILKRKAVVNLMIVIINVVIFAFLEMLGNTNDAYFMVEHGAMYDPYVLYNGEYYRMFTCMFLHFGINHLANNMLILFCLGDNLERAVGKIRYLIIYILSGIGVNILSYYFSVKSGDYTVSAGASGAIFGVIGALLYVVVLNRGKLEDLTTRKLVFFIALSLYFGFTSSGVDNLAHVGGLLSGILVAAVLYRKPKKYQEIQ